MMPECVSVTHCFLYLIDLMAENHVLRGLLKNVAGFIGDGAGGLMSKLGWDMADFESLINKSDTDTAWESFQSRKHSQKTSQASSAMSSMLGVPGKRPAEDDIGSAPVKKARGMGSSEQNGDRRDSYPLMLPMTSTAPSTTSLYPQPPPPGRSPQEALFSDFMHSGSSNSPAFMSTATSTPSSYPGSTANNYRPYVSQMDMNVEQSLGAMSYSSSKANTTVPAPQRVPQNSLTNEEPDDNDIAELQDPKNMEAMKLIKLILQSCFASDD